MYTSLGTVEKLLIWIAAIAAILVIFNVTGMPSKRWDAVGALATAAAAAFARLQIYYTRTEARRRTTFEHIREVVNSLKPLWPYDTVHLQEGVLAFYKHEIAELPEGSTQYLTFLGTADLLAFAIEKNSVDREMAIEYLQSLFNGDLITPTFLVEFQGATNDDQVYRHLLDLRGYLDMSTQSQGS